MHAASLETLALLYESAIFPGKPEINSINNSSSRAMYTSHTVLQFFSHGRPEMMGLALVTGANSLCINGFECRRGDTSDPSLKSIFLLNMSPPVVPRKKLLLLHSKGGE